MLHKNGLASLRSTPLDFHRYIFGAQGGRRFNVHGLRSESRGIRCRSRQKKPYS